MDERMQKIQEYTETAIRIMNEHKSFEDMRMYLEKAFALCSPTQDLGYYQIIATVFSKLHFHTRTMFGTSKVKKQYEFMYEYFDRRFSNIVNFQVDATNWDEAQLVNSLCCDIYNGAKRYYQAFANAYLNGGSIWGLVGIGIGYSRVKSFKIYLKSFGTNAARVLRKYKNPDEQILQNIKTFENGQ